MQGYEEDGCWLRFLRRRAAENWRVLVDTPIGGNMIYGYIRVSSEKQTVENQRFEIKGFAKLNGMRVGHWVEETASGTIDPRKRELGRLLDRIKEGDLIICSEISRLGRSLFMIMNVLNTCMERGCRVWTIKDCYRLGEDVSSKVLAFAFALSAEIERNLISQRTRDALARRAAEGKHLGRPTGYKPRGVKLQPYAEEVRLMLFDGHSYASIGRTFQVHASTVRRFVNEHLTETVDMLPETREREL